MHINNQDDPKDQMDAKESIDASIAQQTSVYLMIENSMGDFSKLGRGWCETENHKQGKKCTCT